MQYPNNLCLGHRPITYGEPGAYVWQTYKEIGEKVDAIAGGIMHLGHQAHGRIGVYGINSPEWMITMQVVLLHASIPRHFALILYVHSLYKSFMKSSLICASEPCHHCL